MTMSELSVEKIEQEILPFLSQATRADVRSVTVQYFLGLTGTTEGQNFINANVKYIKAILSVLDDEHAAIAKDAYLMLVNLTTADSFSWKLLTLEEFSDFVTQLIKYVLKSDSVHADIACMILSNLTRSERCSEKIVQLMIDNHEEIGFDKVIYVFCQVNHNKDKNVFLHYLGPFLSNLTQVKEARRYVLDRERCVVQRLLPYTQYSQSLKRRGGIVGTLKNCCFETEYHEWLLSDEVDILPRLLLPLAGGEEFDEDDMEKLPVDLQYLEPDKQREEDPDIRKMLVECINILVATKPCRLYVRDKNAYVILRELDNWEEDPSVTMVIHNTIQILLGDEPEPGMEDLDKVEIPEDIEKKLQEARELELKDVEKQMEELSRKRKTNDVDS